MTSISTQKCFNHHDREAAARCPECHRSFCRECVTEHDDRVICASCLKKISVSKASLSHPWLATALLLVQSITAFMVLWLVLYYTGIALSGIPDQFHEGTLWQNTPWNVDGK